MKQAKAEIIREYGPFPGADKVHGVSYDGKQAWFASGDKLNALDLDSGKITRSIECRRACWHRLRWPASVSDCRKPDT
ncbi:MAG: hypothetical protein QM808_03040 [Steroidobacteraceae bacterium]